MRIESLINGISVFLSLVILVLFWGYFLWFHHRCDVVKCNGCHSWNVPTHDLSICLFLIFVSSFLHCAIGGWIFVVFFDLTKREGFSILCVCRPIEMLARKNPTNHWQRRIRWPECCWKDNSKLVIRNVFVFLRNGMHCSNENC